MGPGACGFRRRKRILRIGLCLLILMCLGTTLYLYKQLQEKVPSSVQEKVQSYVNELLAFKPQQESLYWQLEAMYEHRARLELSRQKERAEHKTKDDFVIFKSDDQEGAMNHFVAPPSHKILKKQHEGEKKQLMDLQEQYNSLKLENRRALESHNRKYAKLQRENEEHVRLLLVAISELMEENMVLRKAQEEVRSQLLSAQEQLNQMHEMNDAP